MPKKTTTQTLEDLDCAWSKNAAVDANSTWLPKPRKLMRTLPMDVGLRPMPAATRKRSRPRKAHTK